MVCTYVLCSVDDPAAALAEIARVLAPGGSLLFLEHVRAGEGTALGRLQDLIEGPHRIAAAGCRPNRRTEGRAGRVRRSRVDWLVHGRQPSALPTVVLTIMGAARRDLRDLPHRAGFSPTQASSSSSGAWSDGFLPLR